jgi:hypothetical protein
MARRLWALRKDRSGASDETTVFADADGVPIDASTAFRAVKSAAIKAGVPWAGLHTLRHTCATILFARRLNAKQVQCWLGHHAASFTLDTYIGLLNEELPEPTFFDDPPAARRPPMRRPRLSRSRRFDDVPYRRHKRRRFCLRRMGGRRREWSGLARQGGAWSCRERARR